MLTFLGVFWNLKIIKSYYFKYFENTFKYLHFITNKFAITHIYKIINKLLGWKKVFWCGSNFRENNLYNRDKKCLVHDAIISRPIQKNWKQHYFCNNFSTYLIFIIANTESHSCYIVYITMNKTIFITGYSLNVLVWTNTKLSNITLKAKQWVLMWQKLSVFFYSLWVHLRQNIVITAFNKMWSVSFIHLLPLAHLYLNYNSSTSLWQFHYQKYPV